MRLVPMIAALALAGCHEKQPANGAPERTAAAQPRAAAPSPAPLAAPPPVLAGMADVERFIARREQCDHFRGEDGYDAARQKFLDEKLKETCTGTDAELAALRHKYRDDGNVIARLFEFDDKVE